MLAEGQTRLEEPEDPCSLYPVILRPLAGYRADWFRRNNANSLAGRHLGLLGQGKGSRLSWSVN